MIKWKSWLGFKLLNDIMTRDIMSSFMSNLMLVMTVIWHIKWWSSINRLKNVYFTIVKDNFIKEHNYRLTYLLLSHVTLIHIFCKLDAYSNGFTIDRLHAKLWRVYILSLSHVLLIYILVHMYKYTTFVLEIQLLPSFSKTWSHSD